MAAMERSVLRSVSRVDESWRVFQNSSGTGRIRRRIQTENYMPVHNIVQVARASLVADGDDVADLFIPKVGRIS